MLPGVVADSLCELPAGLWIEQVVDRHWFDRELLNPKVVTLWASILAAALIMAGAVGL